jgi:hypothetical protein
MIGWNASVPNGRPVNTYVVQSTDNTVSVAVDGTQTSAYVPNLVNGHHYQFTVTAWSINRSATSAPSPVWTPGPIAAASNMSVTEGNQIHTISIPMRLSHTSKLPVTVNWTTADGTAKAGSDYVAASGSVTIAAGSAKANVKVTILGDHVPEGDETFSVKVTSAVNGNPGSPGTVTLRNDD